MFQCKLVLDNVHAVFTTNSFVTGKLNCHHKHEVRIRTVKIRLDCIEYIKWNRCKRVSKLDNYNNIFSTEEIVYSAKPRARIFSPKEVDYRFRIFLPKYLPPTFVHTYGRIFYMITGTVNPFIWNDFHDVILITVKSPLYLESIFPRTVIYDKKVKINHYLFGEKGQLNMHVYFPQTAFYPEETVDFTVYVKNETSINVTSLKIKFQKNITFFAQHLENRYRRRTKTLLKMKECGVKAYEENKYDLQFCLPRNLDIPNLEACTLITLHFCLKIWCQMPIFVPNVMIQFIPQVGHFPKNMSIDLDKSQYVLPLDQPIVSLEVSSAFESLTDKEKLYAHYISKASWTGGLITFLQTSVESGPIFVLLHKLFSIDSPQDFRNNALKEGFTEDEIKAFFIYTCGVFSNAGNYKGFGDSKFIPGILALRLEQLLKTSSAWPQIESLWFKLKALIYDLEEGKKCLGYAPVGCTTYLSKNCTPEDNQRVQDWMKSQSIEGYNTRLFKTTLKGQIDYEIRLASKDKGELKSETFGNMTFRLTQGDYSPLIGKVAEHLEDAALYAANPTQSNMLHAYAESFTTGSIASHKEGSRFWIKDKGPTVETYIGFIETYRDPAGIRGEFEGFVAVVNQAMSEKFADLVKHAEKFLPLLPWPKGFEKDAFLKPDFTSLDVLTFASSGIPAGINIPNYDDIRQTEGFKNVSLGNVIPASYQLSVTPFLSESDSKLVQQWRVASFELQVGLHELLGHGSGKLLHRAADGSLNFDSSLVDPLTGKPVTTQYDVGDTYDARFGPLSSSYEECRAEAVGLYLSLEPEVLKIFGHVGQQAEDVLYVNWLSLVWNGIGRALETWDPKRGWLQAHAQARFVLARVLMQAGVVKVTQPSEGDLLVSLDRSVLRGAGRAAIGHFLLQLQVYKATGNFEAAQQLYQHYSEVTESWISWRSIVLAHKQPRKMFTQANTVLNDSKVELKTYEESPEGMIQSWVERFQNPESLYEAVLELSASDEHHFI